MKKNSFLNKLKIAGSAHGSDTLNSSGLGARYGKSIYIASLLAVSLAIIIFGLLVVYSATRNNEDYQYFKQIVGVLLGIVLMLII